MRVLVLVLVCLAACVNSDLQLCADVICPLESTCHQGTCVEQAAVTACRDLTDGATCNFNGVTTALCEDQVCVAVGCGTGRLNPASSEVCSDTNRDNGDGCNADCSSNETCGNGVIDQYKGEACDDGNRINGDSCQNTCLLPRCGDGVIDSRNLETCDDGDANAELSNARCRNNCQLARCGDGVRDNGEVCDDGNSLSADGCSFDCKSDETCGNNYTDFVSGEQCDNSVALASDGCGQQCELETWIVEPTPVLAAPTVACHVDFPTRGEHVFLMPNGDTQIFGRLGIHHRLTVHAPPARSECSMAYDPTLDKVFMFGGIAQSEFADLWMFDGTDWTLVSANGPPARYGAGLIYETHRQRLLLFAGRTLNSPHTDTWVFANNQWLELDSAIVGSAPSNLSNWIYSPSEQRVLALTTNANMLRFLDDHWETDARPCEVIEGQIFCYPTVGMFARDRGTIAVLPDGNVVMYGGFSRGCTGGTCEEFSVFVRQHGEWAMSPTTFIAGETFAHLENGEIRAYPFTFEPSRAPTIRVGANAQAFFSLPENRTTLSSNFSAYLPDLGATLHWGGFHMDDFNINVAAQTWLQSGTSWHQARSLGRFYCGEGVYVEHQHQLAIVCPPDFFPQPQQIMYADGITVTTGPLAPPGSSVFGYDPQRQKLIAFVTDHIEVLTNDSWATLVTTNPLPTTITKLVHFRGEVYAVAGAPDVAIYVLRGDTWITLDVSAFVGLEIQQLVVDPLRQRIIASVLRNTQPESNKLIFDGTTWRRELFAGAPLELANFDARHAVLRPHAMNPGNSLVLRTFDSDRQRETCEAASVDSDGDSLAGCADPDCWWRCDATCSPTATAGSCAADRSRCGDGVCAAPLENPAICPADCTVYAPGW